MTMQGHNIILRHTAASKRLPSNHLGLGTVGGLFGLGDGDEVGLDVGA